MLCLWHKWSIGSVYINSCHTNLLSWWGAAAGPDHWPAPSAPQVWSFTPELRCARSHTLPWVSDSAASSSQKQPVAPHTPLYLTASLDSTVPLPSTGRSSDTSPLPPHGCNLQENQGQSNWRDCYRQLLHSAPCLQHCSILRRHLVVCLLGVSWSRFVQLVTVSQGGDILQRAMRLTAIPIRRSTVGHATVCDVRCDGLQCAMRQTAGLRGLKKCGR